MHRIKSEITPRKSTKQQYHPQTHKHHKQNNNYSDATNGIRSHAYLDTFLSLPISLYLFFCLSFMHDTRLCVVVMLVFRCECFHSKVLFYAEMCAKPRKAVTIIAIFINLGICVCFVSRIIQFQKHSLFVLTYCIKIELARCCVYDITHRHGISCVPISIKVLFFFIIFYSFKFAANTKKDE